MDLPDTNLKWLGPRLIYLTRSGSHAYGTNTPESDLDLRGIAIPPVNYFFGYLDHFEQAQFREPHDLTIYDIRKFIKLASDANPNILELLFVDPTDHLLVHPIMKELLARRDLFLSTKAQYTFSGYAVSQLKKLKSHYNRAEGDPLRIDRNPKRAALEAEYGYDTKHAMHLVRLLRMGKEILTGEGVKVRRPDAKELLEIREGKWTYDQVVRWAEKAEAELATVARKSKLPKEPDRKALDSLCTQLVQMSFDFNVRVMAGNWSTSTLTYGIGTLTEKALGA